MRLLYSILALVIVVAVSCTKEPVLDIREGMKFDPDTLILETPGNGWELYTWKSGEVWRFSLLVDSTLHKTSEEILSNPYTVNGREQLKLMLRQIPSGEVIVWRGNGWIDENISGVTSIYKMPALLEQYDIYSFARRNSVDVIVTP